MVPTDGASGVPPTATLRVGFSEAVDPASVAEGTRLLVGGDPVPVELGLTDGDRTAVVSVPGGLEPATTHTLEVGVEVVDPAGHPLISAVSSTFTTADTVPPPAPTVDPLPSPACFDLLSVSGSAEPGVEVAATGDVRPATTIAGGDGSFAFDLEPTRAGGAVEVALVARDPAGNPSSSVALLVELDCTRPRVVWSTWFGSTVALRLSEPVDAATLQSGGSVTLTGTSGPMAFTVEVVGADVSLELVGPPDPSVLPLRLELTDGVSDLAGNPLLPFSRQLADPGSATLVAGEVFDDATSLPVVAATVTLEVDGTPLPDPVSVTCDGRGRFDLVVTSSPVTVRVEADDYLPCWRRVVPVPGASTLVLDARLTPAAAPVTVTTGQTLIAGESELTIPGAATSAGPVELGFSPVSEQGLPGLLPRGWRPLNVVHVAVGGDDAIDPPATLVLAPVAPADAMAARFDPATGDWLALAEGVVAEVSGPGWWALVVPDPEPFSPPPALSGSPLPSADPAPPGTLTATLELDPAVIAPYEHAVATVAVTPLQPAPSGVPVEAVLDEVLHLVDGRVVVAPPDAIDLVLYRQEDGTLAARFGIAATGEALQLPLAEGVKHVRIRELPEGARVETLVGPGGGTVLDGSGLALEIPPGALDRFVGVDLEAYPLDGLIVPLPPGLEAVAGASLDLGGATLAEAASLSFPAVGGPAVEHLLVTPAEVDGDTRWRLVGVAAHGGDRVTCAPSVRPDLPAPWVGEGGVFVLARPVADAWGLVSGTTLNVVGQPAHPATVTASSGLVQLTDPAGVYALAAPAGVVTVVAEDGLRNRGEAAATLASGEHHAGVDLQLQVMAPSVVATQPPAGAVGVSAGSFVAVDLSEPLDPTSVSPSAVRVEVAVGTLPPQLWPGAVELAANGTRVGWRAAEPFPAASAVVVTLSGAVRDLQGYLLDGAGLDYGFSFTVERYLLPDDVDPSRINLFAPGRDGYPPEVSVVEGLAGAVPADLWMWVEDLDRQAGTTTFQAGGDGSFAQLLPPWDGDSGVVVGDRLLLHLLGGDDPGAELGTVPLTPWQTPDGTGAFFHVDGGSFTTVDGVEVTVPWGALPDGGSLSVTLLDPEQALPAERVPGFCDLHAALRLELSTDAGRSLQLAIPGPAPADPGRTMLVAALFEVADLAVPMLVRTATWDAARGAYVTAPEEDLPPDPGARLAKAMSTGSPDPLLPGIARSQTYVVMEPLLDGGGAGLGKGGAATPDLVLPTAGEVSLQPRAVILDPQGTLAYVNTLWSPETAAVVTGAGWGIDPGDPWCHVYGGTVPHPSGDPMVVSVVDPSTGYQLWQGGYPPPGDGWVALPPGDAPGLAGSKLAITGGSPLRVLSFTAAPGPQPLDVGVEVALEGSTVICTIEPGAFAGEPWLVLANLATGATATGRLGSDGIGLQVSAVAGAPMLLAVEGVLSQGSAAARLVFSRRVAGTIWEDQLQVVEMGGGEVPVQVRIEDRVLEVTPASDHAWRSGARYTLRLAGEVFAANGSWGGWLDLPLRAAELASAPPVLSEATVADAALAGDLLLLAARDAGLQVFDLSDPGRPELLVSGFLANEGVAGVAHDGYGHVLLLVGRGGERCELRLFRLAELAAGTADPAGVDHLLLAPVQSDVSPGDLELEVTAAWITFTALAPDLRVPVVLDDPDEPTAWVQLEVPEELMTPHYRVVLADGVTGLTLWQGPAPASGPLTIPNPGAGLRQPLSLRLHRGTLVFAHALGGSLAAARLDLGDGGAEALVLLDATTNGALRDWVRTYGTTSCRHQQHLPGPNDLVFLGQLAVAPVGSPAVRSVLHSASRYDGLWGVVQAATAVADPSWVECLRGALGDTLAAVASSRWRFAGEDLDTTLTAVVGHGTLDVLEVGDDGGVELPPVASVRLDLIPHRVALDPVSRVVLVRDSSSRLVVLSLERRPAAGGTLPVVADLDLPAGSGLGPLLLDPELGLAVTGTAPVQYLPPQLELVADPDGDGLLERVEYLQPLGAPLAPEVGGRGPPHLAWVVARLAGVPDGVDTLRVRVDGLGPGGAPLRSRPEPMLPSSAILELERSGGLPLDQSARHVFVSRRPILLIADERARSEYWSGLTPDRRDRYSTAAAPGVYPLCRHCDRDLDGDLDQDIPWGEPAPRPGGVTQPSSGPEPYELAAAFRLRVTLEATGLNSEWLRRVAESDLAPATEVASVAWAPSPSLGREPGLEARGDLLPEVELASGALTIDRVDLTLPAPGLDVALARTYTSGGIWWGDLGWGWSLNGVDRLRPNPDGTVDLFTATGDRFVFGTTPGHPGADDSTRTAWGHPGELRRTFEGAWWLRLPDSSYAMYDAEGYPTVFRDPFRRSDDSGSELRYRWNGDGTLAQVAQVNGARTTGAHPRAISFEHDPATGVVTAAEDSFGRRYEYGYDSHGRLTEARIRDVRLASLGLTGDVVETYAAAVGLPTAASPEALDEGGFLSTVTDGESRVLLDVGYEEGGVRAVSLGELDYQVERVGDDGAAVTDADQVLETVTWDPLGRVTRVERSGPGVTQAQTTSTTYLDGSRDPLPDTVTLPTGAEVHHVWQASSDEPGSRRGWFNLVERRRTRDVAGYPHLTPSTPLELVWSSVYDDYSNLPTTVALPGDGRVWAIEREHGAPKSLTDPEGRETTFEVDSLGRRTRAVDGAGNATTYAYDDAVTGTGEPSSVVVPSDLDVEPRPDRVRLRRPRLPAPGGGAELRRGGRPAGPAPRAQPAGLGAGVVGRPLPGRGGGLGVLPAVDDLRPRRPAALRDHVHRRRRAADELYHHDGGPARDPDRVQPGHPGGVDHHQLRLHPGRSRVAGEPVTHGPRGDDHARRARPALKPHRGRRRRRPGHLVDLRPSGRPADPPRPARRRRARPQLRPLRPPQLEPGRLRPGQRARPGRRRPPDPPHLRDDRGLARAELHAQPGRPGDRPHRGAGAAGLGLAARHHRLGVRRPPGAARVGHRRRGAGHLVRPRRGGPGEPADPGRRDRHCHHAMGLGAARGRHRAAARWRAPLRDPRRVQPHRPAGCRALPGRSRGAHVLRL